MTLSAARRLAACTILLVVGCRSPSGGGPSPDTPPAIAREMRGIWVATVRNIDWPSRDTLSPDKQRAELIDILDRAVAAGFNTVVFHVRPAADALYRSSLEPWGAMLSGRQGTDPGYDPLELAVAEAHARGLELHAWINPYRAGNSKDSANLAPTHLFHARRDLVRVYGSQLWLDPGDPAVQEHVMRVLTDIMRRYDVDGIHADDYFYPYPEKDSSGKQIDFPDSATYARSGSTLARDDWRRQNVDRLIESLYREAHAIRPGIKVGMSPFGIWRPNNPAGVCCFDAYANLYADARKWLQSGWVDYLVPQLYWAISAPQQSFPALLDWWLAENPLHRHVWPGLATYRVNSGTATSFGPTEIADQIKITRARPNPGQIMFNTTTTLKRNSGVVLASITPLYAERALTPAMPWTDSIPPAAPIISIDGNDVHITTATGDAARWWFVRSRSKGGWFSGAEWTSRIVFGNTRTIRLSGDPARVIVNAVDAAGNMSGPAEWIRP